MGVPPPSQQQCPGHDIQHTSPSEQVALPATVGGSTLMKSEGPGPAVPAGVPRQRRLRLGWNLVAAAANTLVP